MGKKNRGKTNNQNHNLPSKKENTPNAITQKVETNLQKNGMVKTQNGKMMCKITLIDIFTGKREVLDKQMDYKSLSFDFNDANNFSPDTNSVEIAKKAWNHILNPVGVDQFVDEI